MSESWWAHTRAASRSRHSYIRVKAVPRPGAHASSIRMPSRRHPRRLGQRVAEMLARDQSHCWTRVAPSPKADFGRAAGTHSLFSLPCRSLFARIVCERLTFLSGNLSSMSFEIENNCPNQDEQRTGVLARHMEDMYDELRQLAERELHGVDPRGVLAAHSAA